MRRVDKFLIATGIAIMLIAAVGIHLYAPEEKREGFSIWNLIDSAGEFLSIPSAVEVSDDNPFYPLILTPLVIHYDKEGNREVIPLYVKNMTNPSRAILRTEQLVGRPVDLIIGGGKSPKDVSLEILKYWKNIVIYFSAIRLF